MVYSKIHQNKYAFILSINLKKTKCPVCKTKGEYSEVDGEIICKCGYVVRTPYPYVAGKKINTDLPFKINKRRKKEQ